MMVLIIGWYCIFHAILGEIALLESIILKDVVVPEGSRARVNFINAAFLAIAAWCFK